MIVDAYVEQNSGLLEPEPLDYEHSVWFIPEFGAEAPEAGSTVEGLLNRSSLMDVAFRGMQRQHSLIFISALEDPTGAEEVVPYIDFQSYPDFNMSHEGYLKWGENATCDERYETAGTFEGMHFEPRCRLWYQDALEAGNTGCIITNPYVDAHSFKLILTGAAPVFNPSGNLLGVVGLDVNSSDIESTIKHLTIIDGEGYAYLLAPGGEGQVAVHNSLEDYGQEQYVYDLESVDVEEFEPILTKMNEKCNGSEEYTMNGETWLLAWNHETVSSSSTVAAATSGTDADQVCDGFIIVVTVSESALLEAFSETEDDIRYFVALASIIMAAMLLVIGCCTGGSARILSTSITEPVNQLVDVVHALNRRDFAEKAPGTWIVNDVTSPEVEELMTAFQAMTTVVKFANMSLNHGDIDVAQQNYIEAKVLFLKLGNERGVGIVHNNLGSVYTLQAREFAKQAAAETDKAKADLLMEKADEKFYDAVTNYRVAIDDAVLLCAGQDQIHEDDSDNGGIDDYANRGGEFKEGQPRQSVSRVDVEQGSRVAGGSRIMSSHGYRHGSARRASSAYSVSRLSLDNLNSALALDLQLANRKLNLALCLATKGFSGVPLGRPPDLNAVNDARRLLNECATLAANRNDPKGDQRHVECLLEVAKLERQAGRSSEAFEALDTAQRVVMDSHSVGGADGAHRTAGLGNPVSLGIAVPPPEGVSLSPPLAALRQQVLVARGEHCVASGKPNEAIEHWTDAVVGCGDRMDVVAVRGALMGLRKQAENGLKFPKTLMDALGFSDLEPNRTVGVDQLVAAVDEALAKLDRVAKKPGTAVPAVAATKVDLCFVMDCTRSMQSWIDQARNKLNDIIEQAKKDVDNLELRVAFVGYRDFGDKVRCEGPYDFHTEDKIPQLLDKLQHIKATGGKDVPEDIAGGLQHATQLSWKSPIRLCMLIADAPCHGSMYHSCRDNYPTGCPKGLDPSKLLYKLQYELGVDFYFVRITGITDKMISVLQNTVTGYTSERSHARRRPLKGTMNTEPKFMVHDLGCNDHRFLDIVVESVKASAGINLRIEVYC
ncbi:unnamed protein product [Ectocarpus sp. 4 AP-2014]